MGDGVQGMSILNEVVLAWALMVSPSISDYDVELNAMIVDTFLQIDECQLVASTYTIEHAWCEPLKGSVK